MTQPFEGAGTPGPTPSSTSDVARDQASAVAGQASQETAAVAAEAKEQGQRVAEHAAGEAREVLAHAQDQARGLLEQAQGELTTQAGTAQQKAAELLRALTDELGAILDPHNTDYQQGFVTDLAQQASGRLSAAGGWLERSEPQQVLQDVTRFARRRPGAFLALAAVAGLAVGRLSRGLADEARSDDPPRGMTAPDRTATAPVAPSYAAPARTVTDAYAPTSAAYVDSIEDRPVVPEPDARRFASMPEAEQTFTPETGRLTGEGTR